MKQASRFPGARLLAVAGLALLLPLSACMTVVTQQGNVLKPEKVAMIHEQDSRFQVESILGSPVLRDDMHPNRAIYVETYDNPDTGEKYERRVVITYNGSGRVQDIKNFGFGKPGADQPAE